MSQEVTLKASVREPGHPNRLRQKGYVPVVLYGQNVDNIPLKVEESDLTQALTVGAHRGLMNLTIEDENVSDEKERVVMVREIQRHPVKRNVLHMDLYQVDMDTELTTEVPVRLLGVEEATTGIAVVQRGLRELTVECLPINIPDYIEVDISELELGDSIVVADVESPEGVEILSEPDDNIITLVSPRMEEEEEEEEEELLIDEDMEPELIGEEDEEEEEEFPEEEPQG